MLASIQYKEQYINVVTKNMKTQSESETIWKKQEKIIKFNVAHIILKMLFLFKFQVVCLKTSWLCFFSCFIEFFISGFFVSEFEIFSL